MDKTLLLAELWKVSMYMRMFWVGNTTREVHTRVRVHVQHVHS